MAQNDIYKMSIVASLFDQEVVMTHHYRVETATASPLEEMEGLAQGWVDNSQALFLPLMNVAYTLNVAQVRGVTQPVAFDLSLSGNGGSSSSDSASTQVAPICTWRTQQAGRSFRGRSYFPPPAETGVNGGELTAPHVTAMQAYCNSLLQIVAPSGIDTFRLGVYSRKLLQINDVTSFTVQPFVGTQRSRRRGS